MHDEECVQLLQWALPKLQMRWAGFRKVRGQVCKRLQRHIDQLGLDGMAAYRRYLEQHDAEWPTFDTLCRVTISRFYRDKQVFAFLAQTILPALAKQVLLRGEHRLKVWSVGAGSGEEPYTLSLLWHRLLQTRFVDVRLQVLASEADPNLIRRSQVACYDYGTVKNLPPDWLEDGFIQQDSQYCLKPKYRTDVQFIEHDVRTAFPDEIAQTQFDLLLCRNLVFTYFDEPLQCQIFRRMYPRLTMGGALVLGIHEKLPDAITGIRPWSARLRIFEKYEHIF